MDIKSGLPVDEIIPEIRANLKNNRSIVLEAPPGAGKTTIVPLALLDEGWLGGKRIVMLEPRRLAARAAANRMADLLKERVGETVGYRTRLDSRIGPSTRIEVVTEGILTRLLQNDPSLSGTGLLIFDEFHERSIHADLGLALALEACSLFREDLRIIVMSATLNGEEISKLLGGSPIIKSTGRGFPVEVSHLPESTALYRSEAQAGRDFISRVANTVIRTLREEDGGILVFLPGAGEIRRTEAGLSEMSLPPDTEVFSLFGELPKELQDRAIRPSPAGKRKVVLATSIAETSLTIDGVRVVIDGGLMRVPRYSPATGMSSLETIRVTRASAEQRCGRAGRLTPGRCIRLWSEAQDRTLRERNTPEIMEADLAPLALELAVWGIADPNSLRWIDPPPAAGIRKARETLEQLGALDAVGNITPHGREISALPLHPRLGHMVVRGRELGLGYTACLISALLTERDILRGRGAERDSDIRQRLDLLAGYSAAGSAGIDVQAVEMIKTTTNRLKRQLDIGDAAMEPEGAGPLLAIAYPDRIGKIREGTQGRYLLTNGRGAFFQKIEPIALEPYVVAANIEGGERESRIFLAAPVKEAELRRLFESEIEKKEMVTWDQGQKAVSARVQERLWKITLSDRPLERPQREEVVKALLSGIRQNGLSVLPWDRDTENLVGRINLLHRLKGMVKVELPALSKEWLLDNMEEWLAPRLEGMTRLEHLRRLDLGKALLNTLTYEQQRALERLAPTHFIVPTGSRIAVDYTSGDRPILAVRLQEMFGLDRTPAVAEGRFPLVLHLLSPAGRPVQVTEDLSGFWTNSYPMVKKEMKGRYPKHYWPDNPLEAEPLRGVRRKKS